MAATSGWQPQEEPLRQLITYLNDSLLGRDASVRRKAELMLKQATTSPDIDNYLCFLLSSPPSTLNPKAAPESLHGARSAAGLMLKNEIKSRYPEIQSPSRTYIRSSIIDALKDSNTQIRNIAGSVITELVKQGGIADWPEVLQKLLSLVSNEGGQVPDQTQEGAMSALLKVCEDNKKALNKFYQSQRPVDFIIPKLLDFVGSPRAKVRALSIACLNIFVVEKSEPVMKSLDNFLVRLFALAHDNSDEVRKHMCRAIVQIAEVSPEKIAPHMDGLVTFMISQQRTIDDQELALDAAEFWLCIGEDKGLRQMLGPHLPSVVPVLLESMVYNEDDVLRLEGEAEDAEKEDRAQDIKPQFATNKSARMGGTTNGATADIHHGGAATEASAADDDLSEGELEDYDEEDDDENEDPEEQWNLRKCSAAALDVLASVFPQAVFEVTLPYLKTNLTHAEWPNREAAVLAIGAIAEGCMEFVEPNLPDLIPFLVSLLQDEVPIVRQITCWSLGRYSSWAAHLDRAGQEQFFLPMMDGILKRMLDNNKRVQEAAASAFAILEERAGKELGDPKFCEVIAGQFAECFAKYKDRNMFILYDCVQTLAEHVGSTLQSPELVNALMPALMGRWNKVVDESREMFSLNECLSYVAPALGPAFLPYAEPIYARCARMIYNNLKDSIAAQENPALDTPAPDFLITSLDLLSAILQAIGTDRSTALAQKTAPSIFDMLCVCLEHESPDVQQSAYALLGDAAIYTFVPLQASGYLPRILQILIDRLDLTKNPPPSTTSSHHNPADLDETYAVSNNACWSSGEIVLRARTAMQPYVEPLLMRFYTIMSTPKLPPSLRENAAIALGRLGEACPDMLAPHLATLAPPFLHAMASVEWHAEKVQAMKGMGECVCVNPAGLLGENEKYLLEWLRECSTAPAFLVGDAGGGGEMWQVFSKILHLYKQNIPNFGDLLQHLPPENQQALRSMYSL